MPRECGAIHDQNGSHRENREKIRNQRVHRSGNLQ
jgi:hypothetical protein